MYPPPWRRVTFRKLTSDYSFRTSWDETEYALISFLTVCSLFLKEHIMALDRIFPGATHMDNNSWVGTGSWEKKSLAIHHLWHGRDTKTGLRAEVRALSPVCCQLLSFWLIRQSTMLSMRMLAMRVLPTSGLVEIIYAVKAVIVLNGLGFYPLRWLSWYAIRDLALNL